MMMKHGSGTAQQGYSSIVEQQSCEVALHPGPSPPRQLCSILVCKMSSMFQLQLGKHQPRWNGKAHSQSQRGADS